MSFYDSNSIIDLETFMMMCGAAAYAACEGYYEENNQRNADNFFTRSGVLHKPCESGAYKILNTRDDSSYIVHFGLNVASFDDLHDEFKREYPPKAPTGRPRAFNSKMILALVLMWLRTTNSYESLGVTFGAPKATICRGVRLGLDTLYDLFEKKKNDDRWKISWPTVSEMKDFNDMILTNTVDTNEQKVVKGVFGFVDGLNLEIENPSEPLVQNAYYNGYIADCVCSQIIVYTPDGCICYVRSNCPGSWHDAEAAVPLFRTYLSRHCPAPYKLIADSAFPCTKEFKNKILSVPKDNSRDKMNETVETLNSYRTITKHRQPAEWGMRTLKSSFGRIRLRLTVDKHDRAKLLTVIWHLHNYRTRTVGVNQTRSVYYALWMAHYSDSS